MKPRIFVSAVSAELGQTRQIVSNVLQRLGYDPVWQDVFGTESGDLRQALREKIDGCEGLIQIVGGAYGAEPPSVDPGFGRVSYTQFEFLYARQRGKKTWLIFADDGCTRDKPPEVLDLPRDPAQADPAGHQAERRGLQAAWRQRWKQEGHVRYGAASDDQLKLRINELRDEFGELRRGFRRWQKLVVAGLAVLVLIGAGTAGVQWWSGVRQQQMHAEQVVRLAEQESRLKQVGKSQEETSGQVKASGEKIVAAVERAQEQNRQALSDPAVLAETFRRQIRAAAEGQIKVLPEELGRWQKVAEIEKRRDLELGRVDELVRFIQTTLKEGASEVFEQAIEIQNDAQSGGLEEALAYLASRREGTLETARRQAGEVKSAQAEVEVKRRQLQQTVQALVLEADFRETRLQFEAGLQLRQQVAELVPDSFVARNRLGLLLLNLARFREAEPHLRAAAKLAANPPEEAVALSNLARLLQATNRLADAEPLMHRALAIDEQSYGADHPAVATCLNNLAQLLKATNRLAEAEPLMRRALAIYEQSGAEHPNVAIGLNNLAQLLQATNRLAEAEPLLRRALAIDEQSFGAEHPRVAIGLNNLALLLRATNQLAKAEPLMRRALAIDEQSYGAEYPDVATCLNNLALLLQDTNRLAEAEPLMRRALAIDEQSYGADHPAVAHDLNNLARLLQATNRLAEAEPLIRRALAIDERSFGADHPHVAIGLDNLARLLQDTNRLAEAEPLIRRALAIDEQSYGADHPTVAIRLNNLARLLQHTNRLAETEPLMRRALAIDEQSYGADHPNVAIWLGNLARLLQATNRLAEAEPLIRRALAIGEQSYGADHPQVAIWLNDLALLLQATNRLAEAEPLIRRALAIDEQFYGADHPDTRTMRDNYLRILAGMKIEPEEIERRVQAAMRTNGPLEPIAPEVEKLLGPARPVADVLAALDRQYREQGKPAVYFLSADQPIAPHLAELLQPNPESLNTLGIVAFRRGAPAEAIVLYDAALELLADDPQQRPLAFNIRMNRAAARRELGELQSARDELRNLSAELGTEAEATPLLKGRSRYHLSLCEWRLGDRDAALREAEGSLQAYGEAAPDDGTIAPLRKQTEQLLADLKGDEPVAPLPKHLAAEELAAAAELAAARDWFQACASLAALPLKQPAAPVLDQLLRPAASTVEVLKALDRQYREQNKPRVWFLPLQEPISPHLDELLGPVDSAPEASTGQPAKPGD